MYKINPVANNEKGGALEYNARPIVFIQYIYQYQNNN